MKKSLKTGLFVNFKFLDGDKENAWKMRVVDKGELMKWKDFKQRVKDIEEMYQLGG